MKLKPLFFLPFVLLAAGCMSDNDNEAAHPIGRAVVRHPGEMGTYTVDDKDAQMERATNHARRTVGQFIAALQHPQPGQKDFQVKKLFVAKDGSQSEHIWLADVHFTGNRLHGVVDNKPDYIKGLKVGARASVNPDEISDWSYVDNGHLVGGYTVRVIYSELSPQEKQDFEKAAGFHIEQ